MLTIPCHIVIEGAHTRNGQQRDGAGFPEQLYDQAYNIISEAVERNRIRIQGLWLTSLDDGEGVARREEVRRPRFQATGEPWREACSTNLLVADSSVSLWANGTRSGF